MSEVRGKRRPSEIVIFEMLSGAYGWTPIQIRELPVQDVQDYVDIISIRNQLNKLDNIKK